MFVSPKAALPLSPGRSVWGQPHHCHTPRLSWAAASPARSALSAPHTGEELRFRVAQPVSWSWSPGTPTSSPWPWCGRLERVWALEQQGQGQVSVPILGWVTLSKCPNLSPV